MITVDGGALTIDAVVRAAREREPVALDPGVRSRMHPARAVVDRLDREGAVVYGVTTGFGALADRAVEPADRALLQRSVVLSHAAGSGPRLDDEVVRGMILLRARTLAAGLSGVRVELVEALVGLLEAGIIPWVPEHGSLGASGDLAPLAAVATVLLGEGWTVAGDGASRRRCYGAPRTWTDADRRRAEGRSRAHQRHRRDDQHARPGRATTSRICCASPTSRARSASRHCSAPRWRTTSGWSHSARRRARPTPRRTCARSSTDSPIVASHRPSRHAVQDAYSLRCAPQVHGAARDVVAFCRQTVEHELASVVDNPVVLDDDVVSAGNFHGQALAYAADMLASACADVAAISERRVDRLLDPARSRGLPAFLSPEPGLNSGLMITQYTAAAMVASLRHAATPFAVQSAATSAGQEDHVSMGYEAALRTRRSVALLRAVLAIEVLGAAQAIEMRHPLQPARRPATVDRERCATRTPPLGADRILSGDLEAAEAWARDGEWRDALAGAGVILR